MDALVHEAAAVLGPGAPPGGLAVVAPVPVPPHVDRSVGHAPEATLLHGSADVAHGDVEAVLVAGRYLHAALLGAPHDLVGVGHRHRDGLLDYRVDARPARCARARRSRWRRPRCPGPAPPRASRRGRRRSSVPGRPTPPARAGPRPCRRRCRTRPPARSRSPAPP